MIAGSTDLLTEQAWDWNWGKIGRLHKYLLKRYAVVLCDLLAHGFVMHLTVCS
jgi:hypothetical protein